MDTEHSSTTTEHSSTTTEQSSTTDIDTGTTTEQSSTKHLVLNIATPHLREKLPPKEKHKKVIAESEDWALISQYLDITSQKEVLNQLSKREMREVDIQEILCRMIKAKLSGYKSQDRAKEIYDENLFIGFDEVVAALLSSELTCFYCKGNVHLFYEYVREPRQWTLDRIDNQVGHNRGNVEIACLECNLRRKTMYHERYVYTKQAVIRKV